MENIKTYYSEAIGRRVTVPERDDRVYLVNLERCTADEFFSANEEDEYTCEMVDRLAVNESVILGGGAQPEFEVLRVA